ncbi:ATP dependent DNA ligase [Actinomadura verrucosospora]|uniref:ATP dependent DNA ligase n=1 Tax=Actinomadura verrucosospora TaxID=46165 RepID=A0A7D4A2U7_ACTVE|nr:ATP dependent DNA ligase [Actinomadura verrucosospora]
MDTAAEHGRFSHAVRYVHSRPDLTPEDVTAGLDVE